MGSAEYHGGVSRTSISASVGVLYIRGKVGLVILSRVGVSRDVALGFVARTHGGRFSGSRSIYVV